MVIQIGVTAGGEIGVINWTDSTDTSLVLESSKGATTLSDLSSSVVSNVHVHSSSQRADSVVES